MLELVAILSVSLDCSTMDRTRSTSRGVKNETSAVGVRSGVSGIEVTVSVGESAEMLRVEEVGSLTIS